MHNVVDTQSGNHLGGQHGIDRLKLPQNYFIYFFYFQVRSDGTAKSSQSTQLCAPRVVGFRFSFFGRAEHEPTIIDPESVAKS